MPIVFDLGAVVFRWRPAVLMHEVLPGRAPTLQAGAELADLFFQGFGDGAWAAFDQGLLDVHDLVALQSARMGVTPAEVHRIVDAVPAELQPLPGTVRLIERLKAAGHRLHYLSNMPLPYAAHLESTYPFADWFEGGGLFSSRVKLIKPDPAIFALAASQGGFAPADGFFIDDSPRNVTAARACGWAAVQFTDAPSLEADLTQAGLL